MDLSEILKREYGKELKDCTNQEIYAGLLNMVQKKAKEREMNTGKKKLYYILRLNQLSQTLRLLQNNSS